VWLASALGLMGDLPRAVEIVQPLADEAEQTGDVTMMVFAHVVNANLHAYRGDGTTACAAAQSGLIAAEAMGGYYQDAVYAALANAALAAGDAAAALGASGECRRHTVPAREVFIRGFNPMAEAALASGDLVGARAWADHTVAMVPGGMRAIALTVRAGVAMAQGDAAQAERDAHEALALGLRTHTYFRVPDAMECLARLGTDEGNYSYAVRLLGAADAAMQRMGRVRYPMYQSDYESMVDAIRERLGQDGFDATWAEGAALSTEESIAYAQRGRGERKRAATGWASLTPMENDVVRLVREGLGNKEIAARLFISPRTVQTHLTHVYAKLGIASRVQLFQESGFDRQSPP
jgi:DNA-binding CsgD family transcriptional regulator